MIVAESQERLAVSDVDEAMLCHCHKVTVGKVKAAIRFQGADSADSIGDITRAGTACGSCRCRLERVLMGLPLACGPCGFCTGCNSIATLCRCADKVA